MKRIFRLFGRLLPIFGRLAWVWALVAVGMALAVLVYGRGDRAQPADVIVVLGSGLRANGQPGPAMTRRVTHGATLWHERYAPIIVCSGGLGLRMVRTEAAACAELLMSLGVPETAIVQEDRSRSTEENALYTQLLMEEHGWQTALVVSDGYHLMRASWIFASAGFDFTTSRPPDDPPPFDHIRAVAREVVAIHWYMVKTALNLPFTYVPVL
jgi:uncharacterized SAM-binding protein YcdF (DUF218 family)